MPKLPKFLRDRLPAPAPEPMRPAPDGREAPKDWRPITPPKENLTAYDVVDFAIGNRVVAQHGDGAGEVKATGTSAKGPGRANPQKQVLTKKEEASLPTIPNGTQGTVRAVLNRYIIVELDGDAGTWEFWKDDFHNMTPPDIGSRYWGGVEVTAADLLPGGVGDDTTDADVDATELAKGQKHELEHTNDLNIATEIARDHLTEDSKYYTNLQKIEATRTRVRVVADDLKPKDLVEWQGYEIAIEARGGETRNADKRYPQHVPADWIGMGYFVGLPASDGDSLDACVGPVLGSVRNSAVYVIEQTKPDEDTHIQWKVMLGFSDEAAAVDGFLALWPESMLGRVESFDADAFTAALPLLVQPGASADVESKTAQRVVIGAFEILAGPEKLQFLLNKHPDKADVIKALAAKDPTADKQEYKYLDYMFRQSERGAEIHALGKAVSAFHGAQKYLGTDKIPELKAVSKDINKYKTLDELEKLVSEIEPRVVGFKAVEAARAKFKKQPGLQTPITHEQGKAEPLYVYALREFSRNDPTGQQAYLDWAMNMAQLVGTQQLDATALRAAIVAIRVAYGQYAELAAKRDAIERISGEDIPDIYELEYTDIAKLYEKHKDLITADVTPPPQAAETDDYVAYGPITDHRQLCLIGTTAWCVADWSRKHFFYDDQYMGNESGDPHFFVIESKSTPDTEKYLAFVRNDATREVKDIKDQSLRSSVARGLEDIFDELGLTVEEQEEEPEPDWTTTYAVATLSPGGQTWGHSLRRAIQRDGFDSVEEAKEWVIGDKPELTETGYVIAVATYDANAEDVYFEWEVHETVEPAEPVEAFFATLTDDVNADIVEVFETKDAAAEGQFSVRGWLNEHADAVKLTGYTLWKGLVPAWQIEHADRSDWDFATDSITKVKTVKPNKAAKTKITVYALRSGDEILLADDNRRRLQQTAAQSTTTRYGGYDVIEFITTAGNWAALANGFVPLKSLLQVEEQRVLETVPLRDAITYVVWDPDVGPIASTGDLEEATETYNERVESMRAFTSMPRTTQLLEVTHPGNIAQYRANAIMAAATAKRVLQQNVPDASGQESLALPREQPQRKPPDLSNRSRYDDTYLQRNLALLNSLPIGAVVKSRNRAGREYTKIEYRGQGIWQDQYGHTSVEDIANEAPAGIDVLNYGGVQTELPLTGVDRRITPGKVFEQLNALATGTIIDIGNQRHYVKGRDGYWRLTRSTGEADLGGPERRPDYFSALTNIKVLPPAASVTAIRARVRVSARDLQVQAEAFHGTPGGFVELDHDKSGLGTHFGTYLSAHERWNDRRTETDEGVPMWEVRLYDLDIERPLRMTDIGPWHDLHITTPALREEGIVTPEQARAVLRMPEPQAWAVLRAAIEAKGYDAIVYRNAVEDKGKDSYIVWRPGQAKLLTTETVDGITQHTGGSARLLRVSGFEILAGPERVEILKKKYPAYTQYIDRLASLDPTGDQYKYLDAALRLFLKSYRPEWPAHENANIANQLGELLYAFHRAQKYLGTDKYVPALKTFSKDINQYKTVSDLRERMREVDELLEGVYRVEEMQTKYGKPYEYAIREFARNDPTGKQEYLSWAIRQYRRNFADGRWYEVKADWPEIGLSTGERFYRVPGFSLRSADGRELSFTDVSAEIMAKALDAGTIIETKPTQEERKAVVQWIQSAYGTYHEVKQQASKINQTVPPIDGMHVTDVTELHEKYAPLLSGEPPPVAAQTDDYVAYGPITNKGQLCASGINAWCVARWGQTHFESTTYMGDESGNPHFFIIKEKTGGKQWLAFVRGDQVIELKNEQNQETDHENFADLFSALGFAPSLVTVYYVTELGGNDIRFAAKSRPAVVAAVDADRALRGSGYVLFRGKIDPTVLLAAHDTGDYASLEPDDEIEVKRVKPETEQRFLVGPADADVSDTTYILQAFENIDGALTFARQRGSDYTIWSADVPINYLDELPRQWEYTNTQIIAQVAPGDTQTQTSYALFDRNSRYRWRFMDYSHDLAALITAVRPGKEQVIKEYELGAQELSLLDQLFAGDELYDHVYNFDKGQTVRQYNLTKEPQSTPTPQAPPTPTLTPAPPPQPANNPNEVTMNPNRVGVRVVAFDVLAGPERLKVLKEKHPEHAALLDSLATVDPTGEQYKYLDWMLRFAQKNNVAVHALGKLIERLHAVMPYLGKGELKEQPKDINKYKTPDDIMATLDAAEPWLRKREADYETVFEDADWIAYDAKNKAATCELADNIDPAHGYSYWCVARPSQKYYEGYAKQPHRFIIIKSKTNAKLRFLAFIQDGAIVEIKDYHNNVPDWDTVPTHVFDDLSVDYTDAQEQDGEVTVFFLVAADSRVVIDTNEQYVRNYADDDRTLRGWGYEIRTGVVGAAEWEQYDGDDPDQVDVYNVTLVEAVEPETETRFMIGPYGAEQNQVWIEHETEAEAREWLKNNAEAVQSPGYRIWSGDVTLDQIDKESVRYWSVGNEKELAAQEPASDADEELEIYFVHANGTVPGTAAVRGIVFATDDWTKLQTHLTRTSIADNGDYSVYNTQITAKEWHTHDLTEHTVNYQWLKAYLDDATLLDTVPPVMTTRYLLLVNDVPRAANEDLSDATAEYDSWFAGRWAADAQTMQLVRITVPAAISKWQYADNLKHAKTQQIVKQWTRDAQQTLLPTPAGMGGERAPLGKPKQQHTLPGATTLPHPERVQALDALPAGSVVQVTDLPWAQPYSYTKREDGKWFRTSWGPDSQAFLAEGIAHSKFLRLPDEPFTPTPTEQLPLPSMTARVRIDAASLRQATRVRFVDELNQQGELLLERVKAGDRVRLRDEQDRLATVTAVDAPNARLQIRRDLPSLGAAAATNVVVADAVTVVVNAEDERISSHRIKGIRIRRAVMQLSTQMMRTWMREPQEFTIVSANVQDNQTPKENRAAHTALLQDLARMGYTRENVHPLAGQFFDASRALRPEASFLVMGMPLADGLMLARKYKQQAVIYKAPTGEVAAYYTDGHVAPALRGDQVVTHERAVDVQPRAPNSPEGLWSKAKGISFEFPIDWDRKIKTEPGKLLSAEEMQRALPAKPQEVIS